MPLLKKNVHKTTYKRSVCKGGAKAGYVQCKEEHRQINMVSLQIHRIRSCRGERKSKFQDTFSLLKQLGFDVGERANP